MSVSRLVEFCLYVWILMFKDQEDISSRYVGFVN